MRSPISSHVINMKRAKCAITTHTLSRQMGKPVWCHMNGMEKVTLQ